MATSVELNALDGECGVSVEKKDVEACCSSVYDGGVGSDSCWLLCRAGDPAGNGEDCCLPLLLLLLLLLLASMAWWW